MTGKSTATEARPPLRVALIGFGLGGAAFHAPLIAAVPGLRLAAIVTGSPVRQAQARGSYPDAEVLSDPESLWRAAGRYDLVVISTPNRTHVPLALAALHAGLHAVVDKPFAPVAAEARRVIAAARAAGRVVTVYQNRRWDGDFMTVRRLVQSGRLGRISRFESRMERWRPVPRGDWRDSADPADAGGLLHDLGTHLIDQAVVLFGPPTSVHAELDARRQEAIADDDVFVALTHAGGVRSHLYMSAVAAQAGPRFRVLGDRAAFVKHGVDPQEAALREGRGPSGDDGWGADEPGRFGTLGVDGAVERVETAPGAYQDFYVTLAAAIRDGGEVPVDPADAVVVLEIIAAARAAAARSSSTIMHGAPGA